MNIRILFVLALIATSAIAQQPPMPNLDDLFFKEFDADGSGQVSEAEFLAPSKAQFEHMDRDNNGRLDQTEVSAFNTEMARRMSEMHRRMQRGGGPQTTPGQ